MEKLKRCPFCGGKPEIVDNQLSCTVCWCEMDNGSDIESQITRWNTRQEWVSVEVKEIAEDVMVQIEAIKNGGEEMDACSWGYQEGVILRADHAEKLITALPKPPRKEGEEFEAAYFQKPNPEMIEKQKRAYNALLAYEKNCLKHEAKYINPQMAKIPKGERMNDFAMRYGTTIKEMKDQWRQVESTLANGL